MSSVNKDQIDIEIKEHKYLQIINHIVNDNLEEFNDNIAHSLNYIKFITLPIIMASIEDKAYNPFASIYENLMKYILSNKMLANGFSLLPLGYSSDLCFENDEVIINIDIKTANINNPADFSNEIALGKNQTSYAAKLPLGNRGTGFYKKEGINDIKAYPFLPYSYSKTINEKTNLTYGLIFIYPAYDSLLDSIRNDYEKIVKILDKNLRGKLKFIFKNYSREIDDFLSTTVKGSTKSKGGIITENLIRGLFIQREKMVFSDEEIKKIKEFEDKLDSLAKELMHLEISPIAIISISIPNGYLAPIYDDQIVSGKSYGNSIRFHYEDGKYLCLEGKPSRVIFIYLNKHYLDRIKRYFKDIVIYKIVEQKI